MDKIIEILTLISELWISGWIVSNKGSNSDSLLRWIIWSIHLKWLVNKRVNESNIIAKNIQIGKFCKSHYLKKKNLLTKKMMAFVEHRGKK